MFMQIAIVALAVGVILFVGFIVIAQVRVALPTPQQTYPNSCYLHNTSPDAPDSAEFCNTTATCYATAGSDNTSTHLTCDSTAFVTGTSSAMTTVFAGFGLVAVGIIVLAAFGLIQVFQ